MILTADDFGASENINQGIRLAARAGVITGISAMRSDSTSLPEPQDIARDLPHVGIGVHLNITTGRPVLPPEQILPRLKKVATSDLKQELRAQIEILRQSGIRVDHLSSPHGVLSMYSPFLDVVLELAEEYSLPVRSCIAASVRYPDLFSEAGTRKKGRSVAAAFALRNPLAALSFLRYMTLKEMKSNDRKIDLRGFPHPDLVLDSFYREASYPSGLDLEYFRMREYELITAIGYQDIPRTR